MNTTPLNRNTYSNLTSNTNASLNLNTNSKPNSNAHTGPRLGLHLHLLGLNLVRFVAALLNDHNLNLNTLCRRRLALVLEIGEKNGAP